MVLAQMQTCITLKHKNDPNMIACNFSHLMSNKGGKNSEWKKDNMFNYGTGKTESLIYRRKKFFLIFHSAQKSTPNGSKILM